MRHWVLILLLVARAALAGTVCPETDIVVSAPDRATEAFTCEAVDRCAARLDLCGLEIFRPVTIALSGGPILGEPDCMGAHLRGEDRIEILHPPELTARLRATLPVSGMSDTALFDVILLHELVHAAIGQMDVGGRVSRLEDEYIAYAIALDAVPAPWRDRLVASRGYGRPVRKVELTEDWLWVDPVGFGLLAWLHYSTAGNGCTFVTRLLDGSSELFDRAMFFHP